MVRINWDPVPHLGPLPVNWYGLFFLLGFVVGWMLVRRWAPRYGMPLEHVDGVIVWIVVGTVVGARLYFVIQNEPLSYSSGALAYSRCVGRRPGVFRWPARSNFRGVALHSPLSDSIRSHG